MFRKIKLACVVPLLLTLGSVPLAVARQAGGAEPPPGVQPAETLAAGEVDIRWTADGIPHVRAEDWQALGAGVGYAQAQDALCTLAEAFVTYEGRRAWFFGAGERPQHDSTLGQPTNIELDFFFRAFGDDRAVARVWAAQPPALRSLVTGYAEGYNRYLAEQSRRGKRARQRHACIGKDWVRPIVPADLYRRFHAAQIAAGYAHFIPELVGAKPPGVEGRQVRADGRHRDAGSAAWPVRLSQSVGHRVALGSNMIALGDEATHGEGGVLLGNPHWYWSGPDRFYQMHLTIPGRLDVAGVGFLGVPVVMLGFNRQVAWSHTVSAARRFGLFELKLDPKDPTRYEVDGRWHAMTHKTVTVDVRDKRGRRKPVSRVFYDTRFGPLIDLSHLDPALGWGSTRALAFRDVNAENFRVFPGFLRWNQAGSLDEFIAIQRDELGIPWVNTAAIGRGDGRVWYADVGAVPNVSDALRDECRSALSAGFAGKDPTTPVLDGTRSACQWPANLQARQPGAMSPDEMPWLLRRDYVANMNDSYWLSNVHQPLEGFAQLLGGEREPLSWRSRQGHRMALSILAGRPGSGAAASERLRHHSLNDVLETARLFRDDWLAAACSMPAVRLSAAEREALGLDAATMGKSEESGLRGKSGQNRASKRVAIDPFRPVALAEACAVLKRWDGRGSTDSRGALLWELAWTAMEVLETGEPAYDVAFSVADPLNTPRKRKFVPEQASKALAAASLKMHAAGLALDVPLGQVRYLKAGTRRVPLFGGCHQFGYFVVGCEDDSLQPLGPNALANTYLQVVHFDRDGAVAHTLLAHGQDERVFSTGEGLAPVRRYARKDWLRFPFRDADIRRDPSMRRQVLRFTRP